MAGKAGANRGVRNSTTRITVTDVALIRYLHDRGWGYRRIARRVGCSWDIARDVLRGKSWEWVK